MVYVQPGIRPRKGDAQTSLGFRDTNGSFNPSQTTRTSDCQTKIETLPNSRLCCFGLPQGKTERNRIEEQILRPC